MRFRNKAAAMLLLAVAIVIALLLLPLPVEYATRHWPALTQELENLGHPLAFALLAQLAFQLLRLRLPAPSRAPFWLVLGGAALLGVATEALQRLVGRDSAWIDLGNDMLGAGFALLLLARKEVRRRGSGGGSGHLAAAGLTALLATGPFLWTLAAYAHRAQQMPVLWRADAALFTRFSRWQEGGSAGLNVEEPSADWSGYSVLAIDLRNLRELPLSIVVRVHDVAHDMTLDQRHEDRFNHTWNLAGGTQTLRIPLAEIRNAPQGRTMDMQAISGIVVFQSAANEPAHLRVDEIRLER